MKSRRSVVFFTSFLIAWSIASRAFCQVSWSFQDPEELKGWRGEGVEATRLQEGVFQILGREQFQLISVPKMKIPIREKPYLRIRYRLNSPRYLRLFYQTRSGKKALSPATAPPPFDRNFHACWIPLTAEDEVRDTIDQVRLIFEGRPGWVEIDSIEIKPFSLIAYLSDQWFEFWLPRNLHPGTINSLNSPLLFGRSFISWLNKIALIIIITGAFFYFRARAGRKVKVMARIGAALLALWIIYDLRESYSQFKIEEDIYQSYIKPPPGQKTFPALGDFYRFVSFCRSNIPRDSVFQLLPKPYWPFDCRLKYFLYPSWEESKLAENFHRPKYFITYRASFIRFDPASGRLVRENDNAQLTPPGRVIAHYNSDSLIFKTEQ